MTNSTTETEDAVGLDMTPVGAFKLPRWQYELRAAAACLEAEPALTPEYRKSISAMLGRHQTAIQSLSERIAVLEGAADHLLHRVPIEPGMNREPFERLRASLTLGGNG